MAENVCVKYPEGSNGTTQLRLDKDIRYIPRLYINGSLSQTGGADGIQINHAGASAMSSRIGMQPVSASRFPSCRWRDSARLSERGDLAGMVKDCGTAAKRAVNAGIDVVDPCRHSLSDQPVLIAYYKMTVQMNLADLLRTVPVCAVW